MYESNFEENLYNQRREKLRQIAALGQQNGLTYAEATYPNSYPVSAPGWNETDGPIVPWLKAKYDSYTTEQLESDHIQVSLAGRIMAIRVQGKAGFAQIQQGGQRFQIYVRKDDVGETAFAIYKLLDLGDHIGVRGFLMRTRTGELTLHAAPLKDQPALTFLAKAMLALPDKYHGLEDTELRYRQRYVDLFMNTGAKAATNPGAPRPAVEDVGEQPQTSPELTNQNAVTLSEAEGSAVSPATEPDTPNVRETFVKRAAVLRAIRKFFDTRGYLEVETPMMHQVAGGAAARPFITHHNELDMQLYLRIAPELYLKRLVVGGLDRVYEINRNFRNEGVSTRHNPEFTMLEFYQAYANYKDLMKLSKKLIAFVAMEVNGTTKTIFNGNQIDLAPENWEELSMVDAIIKWFPESVFGRKPETSTFDSSSSLHSFALEALAYEDNLRETTSYAGNEYLQGIRRELHRIKHYISIEPLGKLIASLFEAVAEPHLIQPTIIYDFPLAVSPLSKKKPDKPDWVERFEFYIGGFEVGNAFSELNDPDDQLSRFEAQMAEKNRGDVEAMDMDEDYVRALGYGLPPTAGEGIGIDRLTMLLTNSRSIRDVILFPLMRPQQKSLEQAGQKGDEPHGESAE